MKKVLWFIVCLMTMVSANAHNVHYPTYTEDGITYVKSGSITSMEGLGRVEPWDVQKVDKPYDRVIIIPSRITINGETIIVTGIREEAFSTCSRLDSLIISDGIYVGDNTFKGCKELKYLRYSANGFRSKDYNYYGLSCKTLETSGVGETPFWKAIGSSLENLIITDGSGSFNNRMDICINLKTIICNRIDPPYTQAARSVSTYTGGCYVSFESWQWEKITLYVPRESLERYYFDRVWGEIDNIYAIDEMNAVPEEINEVVTDNENPATDELTGDVNNDGVVNVADIVALTNIIMNKK